MRGRFAVFVAIVSFGVAPTDRARQGALAIQSNVPTAPWWSFCVYAVVGPVCLPGILDQRPAALLVYRGIQVGQLTRPEVGRPGVVVDPNGIFGVAPHKLQRLSDGILSFLLRRQRNHDIVKFIVTVSLYLFCRCIIGGDPITLCEVV